jgi:iron complex outermembrane receptor protein
MFVKTRLASALLAAFGSTAAWWSLPAQAQDATTAAPPPAAASAPAASPPPAATQRVEVTGSAIRRVDAETPSPVQIITAEEMKATGFTSVQDVLHNLTANGQGTLSQGFAGAFAGGASGVSLRGLTVAATLVLIDGHRSAPYPIGDDGQRSFVDIASIPFDAVERIEVLKDGASAVYGSDAIAGVVNVILRKSFKGAIVGGDLGISHKGDGTTRHGYMTLGMGDMGVDGHNFYVSAELRNQDQIRYSDRGGYFTKTDYTDMGGSNTTLGVPTDDNNGLARSGTGYVYTGATGDSIVGFMPGCDRAKYDAGQCTYKNTWSQIQPRTQNANFMTRFSVRDASNWEANMDASYFVSKAQQVGGPSRARGSFQGFTSGPGVTPAQLPVVHPVIDITNPSYPSDNGGVTSGRLAYTFLDLGPTTTDTDARTLRTVANIDGHLADWDINVSAGYSQVSLEVSGRNYVDPYNLSTALLSTTDPYLVGQPNTQSVKNFIAPTLISNDQSKLYFAHVGVTRDLMQLQGGPMGFAAGADLMHRSQYAVAPDQVNAGHYFGLYSNNYTIGYQRVGSLYAELAMPFTKTLEVDPQVRFDHYNLSGSRTSPKVGVKWTPTQEFALRGTAGTGFRAPSPSENGTAGQVFFTGSSDDPVLCPHGPDEGDDFPNIPGNFPTQCGISVGTVQTTTPTLKPETSKSFTLGMVAEPVRGLGATLDFYYIQIDNQIIPSSDVQTVRGSDFTPIPYVNPDGSVTEKVPGTAPIAYYTTGYVNANSTKTSGVDIDLSWTHKIGGVGDFTSDFQVSYMFMYDLKADGVTYHLAGTHGPTIIGGDTGSPKARLRWANTLHRGPVSVTGTINYIGGYDNTDPSDLVNGPACADQLRNNGAGGLYFPDLTDEELVQKLGCHTKSFTTFDLQGNWEVAKGMSIYGSIMNLFNTKAPLDWATYGGGVAPYNPSLHSQGAIGRYFTLGASYTF